MDLATCLVLCLCDQLFNQGARTAQTLSHAEAQFGQRRQAGTEAQAGVADLLTPGEVGADILGDLFAEGVSVTGALWVVFVGRQVIELERHGAEEVANGVDRTGDDDMMHVGIGAGLEQSKGA